MNIAFDKQSATDGLIKIQLNATDYQPKVDSKLKDYARKAVIKGFRQGKVPTGVIKKMYGKSILVEEVNHLVSHSVSDYIRDQKLKILVTGGGTGGHVFPAIAIADAIKKLRPDTEFLFVGATGTGKSTSLAAMIGYRNQNSSGHIITIEDPIEFVHKHEGCIVTQREVGIDTDSWENALKNTLRQAPDVIMIGEVRTREGMDHAIAFAETGHLVLCTLHANNANQAMDRIINFFPEDRRNQLLMDLSLNLKGVVAQQLIPTPDGKGRKVAMEILLGTPLIQDYIREGEIHKLKEVMKESTNLGMKTFDQALFELYQAGEISYEDALRFADSQNEVRLKIKLAQGGDARTLAAGLDGVEVAEVR